MAKKVIANASGKKRRVKFSASKSTLPTSYLSSIKRTYGIKGASTKSVKRNGSPDYQVINVATGHYIKRSASTGRFVVKKDGEPFENVDVKSLTPQAAPNPAIDRETANWAEEVVITYLNKQHA